MYISRPQDDQMVESVENILRGSTFLAQESSWLWEEMNDKERSDALTRVVPYLKSFVRVLNQTKIDGWRSQERCQVEKFGTKWGIHQLCEQSPPPTDCVFLSFGIHRDYSFDVDLAKRWNCRGFAADPTVDHKSHLHSLVTFHNIAAKVLHPNQEQSEAKDPWWIASVPATKKFLGISRIHVLKMDCEGCEYSLPRDILAEDPSFFHSVDQFTFEVHLNKLWLDDMESFYYFAMLFKLLHEAGLELMGSSSEVVVGTKKKPSPSNLSSTWDSLDKGSRSCTVEEAVMSTYSRESPTKVSEVANSRVLLRCGVRCTVHFGGQADKREVALW
eukprot:CAMPEP_0116553964 /NCGR_PEP_ID=MMETSP0397-20121206/7330_1 /TAXON_ID=216820 /ORGANISM="Cyclophora tenuis, Strain ECT3854" /LENGTH=329 /DNA_ID=CAMNT_0004079075 /DNA_START=29 /DNA_END=1016 /DNA_ORIENTATION=+